MSNLWPRIEPLLARVEKPARYIGMERGSRPARHGRRPGRLPPRLSRHLRDRAPQPGAPDPLRDPERTRRRGRRARLRAVDRHGGDAAARAASRCSRSTPTAPAGDFDVLAFNLSAELVYTNVLELPRPRRRAGAQRGPRAPSTRSSIAGGHCAFNPEPLADFVDAFVIGDGEEVVGEITEVVGAWKRGGRATREARAARARHDPGRLRARDVRRRVRRRRSSRAVTPALRRRARRVVDKRTVADLAEWPYPKQQLVPLDRGRARPPQRRDLPRLHARLPVLPGGHDHPPGAGAARGAGAHDGAATACAAPATTRSRSRRCRAPTSPGIDGVVADLVNEQEGTRQRQRSRCRRCGSTRSRVGIASEIQKVRRTGLTFAPEARHVADPPGDQQAHHRRRPLRRGRRRVLAGLAAGEALLPHRPADRDGRGHARHRRARHATSSRSAASYTKQASCTVSVGGFVPKPHTPFQWFGQNGVDELRRKIGLLRDDVQAHAARRCSGTTRRRRSPRASRAAATAASAAVIERVWRAGGTFQEWSEHFDLDRWLDAMARRGARPRLVRHPAPHRRRDPAVGPHRRRAAPRLPLAGLAGGAGRARAPRLPVDAVLRLRGVHRLRARARRGVAGRRRRAAARAPARTSTRGRGVPVALPRHEPAGRRR